MKSTPDIITELRAAFGFSNPRKDDDVLRHYRFLLARAIVLCDFSRFVSTDHDVFLRSSHDLFIDTVALVYSDPAVEHCDGIAKLRGTASLMELAQWDAQNLPLEKLSVGRLRRWNAVG